MRLVHSNLIYLQHWLAQLRQHAYASPWFELRSTLQGIHRHNLMGLSAALSFYALFALIPLIVLIFFLLSHLVYASDFAIVKLAILSANLLPEFSQRIMVEVYRTTQTQAAWGMLGLVVLLWTIMPLATHMRSSFFLIASRQDTSSFWYRKIHDVVAVLGVLLVFFLFTAAGFALESVIVFLARHLPSATINAVGASLSLLLTAAMLAAFYQSFCPLPVHWKHVWASALVTASLWMLMRPAFGLFLSLNENIGAVFGSMKAVFVSISWLYMNFAVFLFGIELLVTLRQREVLLLKELFDDIPNQQHYLQALLAQYGKHYVQHTVIFSQGAHNHHYFMVMEGTIHLLQQDASGNSHIVRILKHGDFFGEIALFSSQPATASAVVASDHALVVKIDAKYIDSLLQDDPKIAVRLLKQLSHRVQLIPLDNQQHA